MFRISYIEIENFRSYRGVHKFQFPDQAGLYFLTGNNTKEPKLESNGSGKSSLLDALYWCLFGKSLRGLKANDIINWNEKSCSVTLVLYIGDGLFSVKRVQHPNSLTVNGEIVEQEAVNKLLRLEPDGFSRSVIMAQFNEPFLDLGPTDKLALFSQIMNLDYWLDHSIKADKEAKTLKEQIVQTEQRLIAFETSISVTETNLNSALEQEAVYKAKAKAEIKELTEGCLSLEQALDHYKDAEKAANTQIDRLEDESKEKKTAANSIKERRDALAKRIKEVELNFNDAGTRVNIEEEQLEEFLTIGGFCPRCHQSVDEEHIERERKAAQKKIDKMTKAWHVLGDELEIFEKQLNAETELFEEANLAGVKIIGQLRELYKEQTICAVTIAKAKHDLETSLKQLEKLKKASNPYTSMVIDGIAKIKEYKTDQEKLAKKLEKAKSQYEAISYWVQGFKRVRLFLIEETLRSLELEVNNSLNSLGLNDWSIEFDVERENKSGGVTKGFVAQIKAPGHTQPVRWEAWSGGEAQRLSLAADFGLANLIMQQAGLKNHIEFFDEPSKHLSKAGLMDLAETLHQRAIDDEKVIFLVDHNMPEFGEFAGVIKVTKDAKGASSLEMESNV